LGPAKCSCKYCGAELSVLNPSDTVKKHKCDKADEVEAAKQSSSGEQRTLGQAVPTATARKAVLCKMAMFFFTSGTPFRRIENEHLTKAFSMLGVALCCEKVLLTTMLMAAYEQTQAQVASTGSDSGVAERCSSGGQ
jgi:hypothetical protein